MQNFRVTKVDENNEGFVRVGVRETDADNVVRETRVIKANRDAQGFVRMRVGDARWFMSECERRGIELDYDNLTYDAFCDVFARIDVENILGLE